MQRHVLITIFGSTRSIGRGLLATTRVALVAAALVVSACSSSHRTIPAAIPPGDGATGGPTTDAVSRDERSLADQIGVRGTLPRADANDLAFRYRVTPQRAPTAKPFGGEASVGDRRDFIVARLTKDALSNRTPPEIVTVTATVVAKSAHAYFYEDNALQADPASVQQAADLFETITWPQVTGVFGLPPTPGVDGDPRIIILQSELGGAGGYYSGDDAYLKTVRPLSNEAEMVYMDRTLRAGTAGFNVVLAHELQHLIEATNTAPEDSWENEGLSEDASGLVGGAVSSVAAFAAHPETQLNAWSSDGNNTPHYGAGAAFFRYLASRFGGDPTLGTLAHGQRDGQAGVDQFLTSFGEHLRFRDVFGDWIVANVLNEAAGPYANPGHPIDLRINKTLSGDGAPANGAAHQFGTDYYTLSGLDGGEYTLEFSGQAQTPVLPTSAPDGHAMLWGNAQESIDTRLTRELDLTNVAHPVLTFKTWYDIERWYDWGYVSVSTDNGATWQALAGDHTTPDDPERQAFGPGYTGKSGGNDQPAWIDERVSIAAYAGTKILIRFEFVTDGGTHNEGWAIDDVAVDGTSFTDPGGSAPGWNAEGWVRIDRPLAQSYIVRIIEKMKDGSAQVTDMPLDSAERGQVQVSSAGVDSAVVAVAGTAEGTNQTAPYTLALHR